MEESLSRKDNVVRKESGETSSGRPRSIAIAEEESFTSKLRKEKFEKLKKAWAHIEPNPEAEVTRLRKIQEVPDFLRGRENFKKYFEPRLASLGPIHHGKNEYEAAEDFKLGMASKFLHDSGKSGEFLLGKIEGNIKQLRQYFDEGVTDKYDDETLAWILFVDGCAVLQFIHSGLHTESREKQKIKKGKSVLFAFGDDVLLLENQLPYELLEDLMASSEKKEDLKKSIEIFMSELSRPDTEYDGYDEKPEEKITPIHLLDLLRRRLVRKKESTTVNKGWWNGLIKFSMILKMAVMRFLVLPMILIEEIEFTFRSKKGRDRREQVLYRNVQELKAAGIQVKRSRSNSLRDISFSRRLSFSSAYLCFPPLVVGDHTGIMFMNLIAYEACQEVKFANCFVICYVFLLGSFIEEVKDIKELTKARVLDNLLIGGHQEVLQLIQSMKMCADSVEGVFYPKDYTEVLKRSQKYCEIPWTPWMVELSQNYFRSPWTVFALFGAFILLALSAIQTWYTVYSPASPCDDFCSKFKRNL